MASKKLTDEELFAQFEGIGDDTPSASNAAPSKPRTASTATKKPQQSDDAAAGTGDDPLAELESLAKAKPASRPNTPKTLPGRARASDTPASSNRTSEEGKVTAATNTTAGSRRSNDSSRSYHQAFTPATTSDGSPEDRDPAPQQPGGGWLGSIWNTASAVTNAARQQAEALAKEVQKNEEAQKWLGEIGKGKLDVNTLKGLANDLRSRGQGTFTSLLHTLAPPISQHERLLIHITHDFLNYPSLDPTIYSTFARVMAQVEGGELIVVQRGSDSTPKRTSVEGYRGPNLGIATSGGWTDGPWWRQGDVKRDIGTVKGVPEGTKLARVSAETYANEFFAAKGGVEKAAEAATETLGESNPTRSSDIFLAIQAISYTQPTELFASSNTAPAGGDGSKQAGTVEEPKEEPAELVSFALYLHDPVHALSFATLSQSVPAKWVEWLDAEALQVPDPQNPSQTYYAPPDDIAQIIEEGAIDPREWVAEWVEETLALAVGTIAQRYVARRMGVGEGGIGRGKAREAALDAGAGEVARAVGGL